jgi:hypothetical protein
MASMEDKVSSPRFAAQRRFGKEGKIMRRMCLTLGFATSLVFLCGCPAAQVTTVELVNEASFSRGSTAVLR